jgi:hypothetical protein
MDAPNRLPRKSGIYEFIAPDVREILPSLVGFEILVSSFDSLVSVWGVSYCMTTMLVWREYKYHRQLIHPCIIELGGGEDAPVLVFGPFPDVPALHHFKKHFDLQDLPRYDAVDSVTVTIIDDC